MEIEVSAALLRETAHELGQLIQQMGGKPPALLPGYQVRIPDGNALAVTEHRLKVLRSVGAAALAGKSLNDEVCLHMIRPSRSGDVIREVLAGHCREVWISDLFSAQKTHRAVDWQVCLAH